MVVGELGDATQISQVKARLKARGDQDPDLLSLVRDNQASAMTVSMAEKLITLQVIASLGAHVELGDVTAAFFESAGLRRDENINCIRSFA